MIKLEQAIVVEGKYDKNTLSQLVDAPIFETNGFGVMKDRALVALLRRAAFGVGEPVPGFPWERILGKERFLWKI